MTSKLKCPFCGEKLEDAGIHSAGFYFWCTNCYMKQKEKDDNYTASPRIWQALIQAKQDLEFFKEEQDRSAAALIERTKELDKCQKDLEIANKGLHRVITKTNSQVVRGFEYIATGIAKVAKDTLKQIEHKE